MEIISCPANSRHFLMYKPFGYLSQFRGEKAKQKRLGELYPFPEGIMAIGRLDQDSEGLLLLTTDGKESERVRRKEVEKEYHVLVDGNIDHAALQRLREGVEIKLETETYTTLPCRAERLSIGPPSGPGTKTHRHERHGPTSWISLTLTEGKFRQIRKMTNAVGFPTLRLVRVRIGNIHLGDLLPGQVRETGPFSDDRLNLTPALPSPSETP